MAIIFEDGFESGDISAFDGKREAAGGVVTVEQIAPAFGNYHMVGTIPPGETHGRACVYKSVNLPICYARAYINIVDLPDSSRGFTLISFVRPDGATPGVVRVRDEAFEVVWQDSARGYHSQMSSVPLERGRYYLLELMSKPGAGDGELKLYIDEKEVLSLTGLDSGSGPITEVRFGAVILINAGGATVYADQCAIGDSYIGRYSPLPELIGPLGIWTFPLATWLGTMFPRVTETLSRVLENIKSRFGQAGA